MLFDKIDVASTIPSGITILGLPLSDFINAVIAVVAIAGFIASICISVKTLRQTKELNDKTLEETNKLYKKQNDVSLFVERYKLIEYFISFFNSLKWKDDISEFRLASYKAVVLFKNEAFNEMCYSLLAFNNGSKPLPDYRDKYIHIVEQNSNVSDIEQAFFFHGMTLIQQLRDNLGID